MKELVLKILEKQIQKYKKIEIVKFKVKGKNKNICRSTGYSNHLFDPNKSR